MVIEVTEGRLPEEIMQADVAVVDFWSETCAPCKQLTPILEDLSASLGDKILFCKVNANECSALAAEYKIRGLPALIVLKKGEKQEKLLGLRTYRELEEKLKIYL